MNFLIICSITCLVIISLLLIALVILQGPQDDDGGAMGASKMSDSFKIIGVNQASSLFETWTGVLVALFMSMTLVSSYFIKQSHVKKEATVIEETFKKVTTDEVPVGESKDEERA